jgi:hypothetical protein
MQFHNFKELVAYVIDLINLLLPVIVGLSLLVFFWGLVKFLYRAGDAKSHAEGRNLMIWGIIALFVMLSYYSLISIFSHDLGFSGSIPDNSSPSGLPLLPQPK